MTKTMIFCLMATSAMLGLADAAPNAKTAPTQPLGGVQLWENGPYWAECNVGANQPEEPGYYFWWGDTVGYTREGGSWTNDCYYSGVTWVSSTGTRMTVSPFEYSKCPTNRKRNPALRSAGFIDATGNLVAKHDAATAHLGAPWRMPTADEFAALLANCDTRWTTRNGVQGRLVTGRGAYAANSIFLPAAGHGNDTHFYYPGSDGDYWSSTSIPDNSNYSWNLNFHQSHFDRDFNNRYYGWSVRPLRTSAH